MSHEIRTPLNGVTGMLELLDRTELDSFQRRYIEIAHNSAQSLLSVINDILDFSKIEAGKLELDNTEFQLPELLADVVDIFASQTARKNIELVGNIPPSIPAWVIGDPERLRQVLVNLMGNAVKFTEKGHVALSVACLNTSDAGAVLDIKIEDSGCGISRENLGKLFKSFTQADASTTRKYGGTGLGLTISRQLIELMCGEIRVESTEGKGSVFSIHLTLPVAETTKPAIPLPAAIAGTRIMVVDDHPVNLELMYELLKPFGLEIDCAESAAQALQLLDNMGEDERPYELFLLDYHMPDTDGLELSGLLRNRPEGADYKLIMLTSIDQLSSDDPGMENFDTSLVKPVRASRLFDAISVALAGKLVPEGKSLTQAVSAAGQGKLTTVAKSSSTKASAKTSSAIQSSQSSEAKTATRKAAKKKTSAVKKKRIAKKVSKKTPAKSTAVKSAPVTSKKPVAKKKVSKKSSPKKTTANPAGTLANPASDNTAAPVILIVEDNPINQIVATEILMQAGFDVEVANDGAEGVDRIVQGGVDLVLMDCQMPVLDGFEATKKLRQFESEQGVAANDRMPIIALTANALKGDREACLDAGMDDYVTKPLQPETLFKAMQQFIVLPDEASHGLQDTGT
jgi:CheY-like chemotaxis protein